MFWTRPVEPNGFSRRALHKWRCAVVAGLVLTSGLVVSVSVQARTTQTTGSVALAALPQQAQTTHQLVLKGGPFPFSKDGTVFGNRERLLPPKARGFYREYTVKTPGSRDRGARRIICGGEPPTQPEACFYTDDHYASFKLIAP